MARNEIGFALTARELESAMKETADDEEPVPDAGSADPEEPATTPTTSDSEPSRSSDAAGLLRAIDPTLLRIDSMEDATIGSTPGLSELLALRDRAMTSGRRS